MDNGLQVIIRPVKNCDKACFVLLYRLGNLHDTKGQPGIAHFAEHLYVTAATKTMKAQTAEKFMQRYNGQWNAQTGDDYTVFAAVFKKERLESEMNEAAARMSRVSITQDDLDREVPRIVQEMRNMYDHFPSFAVQNAGRNALAPIKNGQRRIGTPQDVKRLTVKQLQVFADEFYKPNNAILVLVGGFEAEAAKKLVKEKFTAIRKGKHPPKLATSKPKLKKTFVVQSSGGKNLSPHVAVTFANPLPGDPLYPAFVVLINRLQRESKALTKSRRSYPVQFVPLDMPYVSSVVLPCPDGVDPDQQLKTIDTWMEKHLGKEFEHRDVEQAKRRFAFILGMGETSEAMHARNPYLLAFQLGRQRQLGYEPGKLAKLFDLVDAEQIAKARKKFFARENRAEVVWLPAKSDKEK